LELVRIGIVRRPTGNLYIHKEKYIVRY